GSTCRPLSVYSCETKGPALTGWPFLHSAIGRYSNEAPTRSCRTCRNSISRNGVCEWRPQRTRRATDLARLTNRRQPAIAWERGMTEGKRFAQLLKEFERVGVDPNTISAGLAVREEDVLRALHALPDTAGPAAFLTQLRLVMSQTTSHAPRPE